METVLTRVLQLRQTSHIKTKVALDCFRHTYSSALRSWKLLEYTHFKVNLSLNFLKASPGFTSLSEFKVGFAKNIFIHFNISFFLIFIWNFHAVEMFGCVSLLFHHFCDNFFHHFYDSILSTFRYFYIGNVSMKYVADNIWLGCVWVDCIGSLGSVRWSIKQEGQEKILWEWRCNFEGSNCRSIFFKTKYFVIQVHLFFASFFFFIFLSSPEICLHWFVGSDALSMMCWGLSWSRIVKLPLLIQVSWRPRAI